MKLLPLSLAITLAATAGLAAADDGQRTVRQVSSPPGETQNPEPEGEHAFIKLMNFRVPAQAANGDPKEIVYNTIDGTPPTTGVYAQPVLTAKPLINVYVYGPVIGFDDFSQSGFPGHGLRDAFGAVSLDDGETWKVTNLSNSAEESSFTLIDPVPDAGDPVCHHDPDDPECTQLEEYPGEVTNVFHAVAGNRVLVAWQSKFCKSGFPGYTGGATGDADAVATYLGINREADLYLEDLFVVGGSQGSTDYKEQAEFEGEYDGVGEVPYNCLWSARGVLREDPEATGTTELVWFQAERLTSGRRDVNRVETSCVAGAGCAVSWQEDPEGLRPGEGEGAGTGWAGATTNSQTDIWYSFVEWEDMDIVDDNGTATPLADNIFDTGRPQPYVPMMVPVRLSNNARCAVPVAETDVSYCNNVIAGAYGIKNQCVGIIDIPAGQQGNQRPTCVVDVNESGAMDAGDMPNVANTAASRPRLNLQPRDTDGDDVADDAWVIIIHEEDKGLGRYFFQTDEVWEGDVAEVATSCIEGAENCEKADIGKNQWYISFALGTPQTSVLDDAVAADLEHSMLYNLVAQQNQYNAPEVNWQTGTFYPPMSTADMWDFGELNYSIFNTEIARRASLMTQSTDKAETGGSGIIAMPLYKEGIINQGGPADIMARRIVYKCPIEFEDEDGPVITPQESPWMVQVAGTNIKIKGTVTKLDELQKTGFFIRDASNTDYVFYEENTAPQEEENFLAENLLYPPCYIQASDEDPATVKLKEGESIGNWGEAFDLTEYWEEIGVECECSYPEEVSP